ncbi:synaptic vesicle glycoprotein 2A isoform X2 [Bombyx mori]|uniref:Major facilitator superfamily (MFS) profile domain-containing protein n=1 Tax=Bombyx mori TaxID=7091 RepID=A0A8R2R6Y5_BOMMO|nr:synaptic vesicle glycoprotein 2A-like isoform X2 [Bombyx mori]
MEHNIGAIGNDKVTPMQELNEALGKCKFGRFHIHLLFVSFAGSVASVLVTHTTSYLITSAECDLNMDLIEKGMLNASPYLGSLFSSVLAGFLTDTFGRKRFLILGFGGIFIFTLLAGSSQTYEVLLTAKFFEGMCFAISLSASVTYISEFCHNEIRDRLVVSQTSFAAIAQIISTAMAWGILTQDWRVVFLDGKFVLNTWNFYLFAVSLWSFLACILYSRLPESPKYLLTQKKYAKVRNILIEIYKSNRCDTASVCPTKSGTETYTNNMIIGLVSLLPHFITGALVNKVGKKALLVTLCLISAGAISGVRWANSRTAVVALFSLDIAITQSIKSLIQAVTIEFFPTAVRTLTISLVMTFARIGTLVGNVLFPILLDIQCIIPFFSMAGIMTFVTLVTLFLPKKKEK